MLRLLSSFRLCASLLFGLAVLAAMGAWVCHRHLAESAAHATALLAQDPEMTLCGFRDVGPTRGARVLSALACVAVALIPAVLQRTPALFRWGLGIATLGFAELGVAAGWPPTGWGEFDFYFLFLSASAAAALLAQRERRTPTRRV